MSASRGVVFAALCPHPPIIVPEVGEDELRRAAPTVAAVQQMATRLVAAGPRTVVVVGPHGPVARHAFVALSAPAVAGDLAEFGAPEVRLEMRTDSDLLIALRRTAAQAGLTVLDATSPDLDYATLVPLYYLQKRGFDGRVLVLSMAYTDLATCYRFGQAIAAAAAEHSRAVAVLASGDLSHRLKRGAPAGFDPRGAEFDRLVMASLAAGDPGPLLNVDPELREAAGECGLRPIVIMMGAIEGRGLRPEVLSYEGPFGVGYGIAVFEGLGGASTESSAGVPTQCGADPSGTSDPSGETAKAVARAPSDAIAAATGATHSASAPAPVACPHPLTQLARRAIEVYIRQGEVIDPPPEPLVPGLPESAGAFVSLHRGGDLRGCIGTIEPTRDSLNAEVVHNAIAAASEDPRFEPLTPAELADLDLSVDVLGQAEPVTDPQAQLDPRHYGVIVARGRRRGLLLPDLEGVDTVGMQLDIAARKAGLSLKDPDVRLYRFRVERYH